MRFRTNAGKFRRRCGGFPFYTTSGDPAPFPATSEITPLASGVGLGLDFCADYLIARLTVDSEKSRFSPFCLDYRVVDLI